MQNKLANKIRRHTCRCLNPGCKSRWTQAVEYEHTGWNYDRWGDQSQPIYKSLRFSNGSIDPPCPKCGSNNTRSEKIQGKFSPSQPCSARCTSALGADCECQCAGENHGIDHLQKF